MENAENLTSRLLSHRPTYAEVDLNAIASNFDAIRALVAPAKVMACIKANGYGHGLVPVARALAGAGAEYFGVAYIEEAIQLRDTGIDTPILVFGGLPKDQLALYLQHGVDITASSVAKIEQIDQAASQRGKRARVHLKIDTGMERIGVHHYSAKEMFDAAVKARHIEVVGVYSHFANADSYAVEFTETQLNRFQEAVSYYERIATTPFLRHIANSAGILISNKTHLDMVRPGVALFGIHPGAAFKNKISLTPALSLKSKVVYFKVVKKGAGVSYGHTWHAPDDTRVVTVPIGYGDGYYRAFSNKGSVLIRGERYPIVGRVCMDQLMVNIGQGTAYNGDEVVLIGSQGDQQITVDELAQMVGTDPREILVLLNDRVPRIYT